MRHQRLVRDCPQFTSENWRQANASKILKSTMSNIGSLKDIRAPADSAGQISLFSAEISRCIRDIVTFIQFHDITRQQFEYSLSAFSKMAEMLESVSEEDPSP